MSGGEEGLASHHCRQPSSGERLFQAPLGAKGFGSCFAFCLAHALYRNVITTSRYENAATMEALELLRGR